MLGGSFFGKNGGRAASGVVAAEKKNLFFFLRSFPERMFREVNGRVSLRSTLRGIYVGILIDNVIILK
jgi:hypothetical protein